MRGEFRDGANSQREEVRGEMLNDLLEIEEIVELLIADAFGIRRDRLDAFYDAFLAGASLGRKCDLLRHALPVQTFGDVDIGELLKALRRL